MEGMQIEAVKMRKEKESLTLERRPYILPCLALQSKNLEKDSIFYKMIRAEIGNW